ncbi:MAG: ATP-binding cassette domain-containing protein [Bacteroidales bacterium]|nr:ATP-binding cassette domain-containing protein [Bacteroidales bacterium]
MPHIIVKGAIPRFDEFRFNADIDVEFADGENVAIIGPNGAGKSLFVDFMIGNIALREGTVGIYDADHIVPRSDIKYVVFRDIYRLANTTDNYYQQRWNATENEDSPFVRDVIGNAKCRQNSDLVSLLHIKEVLDKRFIFLSSGELRKVQIFRALTDTARLMIIDNPYIGLDEESRGVVNDILRDLSRKRGIQIVLVLSNPRDIPDIIDRVLPIDDRRCLPVQSREDFLADTALTGRLFGIADGAAQIGDFEVNDDANYDNALIFNNVSVTYYKKKILNEVTWQVRRGEKWALLGRNGCGKSTLLSLVCGDNPQAYINDITLFDRRRGTGETIWDIKSHIGYLSPDMHTYYQKDIPCIDVVASGLFDTIGLYRKISDSQRLAAARWLKFFHAEHLAERSFVRISYGEQRLILLTRVFVKQPSLLILDEPLHGLDARNKARARQIIEEYCTNPSVTLIYVTHYTHEIPSCVSQIKRLV